jgi:large subunit ribosomal protein L3
MINTLLGTKKGMTSTYDSRGRRVGATVVEVTSNFVTQVKTTQTKDGYNAVQLGFGTKKSVNKPQLGLGKKIGIEQPIRWFREVKTDSSEDLQPGTEITVNQVFSIGDSIKVSATSKGKGFQGGVRRHGFHGGPKTHGQSDRHRAPGSVGSGTTPGRVYKGKNMAGHMGNVTSSTANLEVVGLDRNKNLITIKGAVPGPIGGLVTLIKLGRVKGYTPPPEEKIDEEEEKAAEAAEENSQPDKDSTNEGVNETPAQVEDKKETQENAS